VNYHWNWKIFWQITPDGTDTYLSTLFSGLGWTLSTALCAWVIALVLGTVVGTVRTVPKPWLMRLGNAYVEFFRNIPLLVQMFLWFFVLPELLPQGPGDAIKQMPPPWAAWVPAVLCLGTYTSARVAEQVRSGIGSLSAGQRMAGTALGLTLPQTYRHVLLPMAFRIILPPLGSEITNIIKNTSIAFTIGVMELTARTRAMQEFSFQVFEAFTAATIIYLLVNQVALLGMRWLEKRVAVPGMIGSGAAAPVAAH
jgi:glutamate/aspartate transport system permease protein